MKTYKGTDKDLKCRNFQFEIGKEYEQKGEITPCNNGFHSCENPLNVFIFYSPNKSRYFETEISGNCVHSNNKIASSKIKLNAEIGIKGIIEGAIKFCFEKVKFKNKNSATGDYSGASATGNCSGASATGNCSGASATGDYSGASATGDYSGASATGDYSGASATGYYSGASATGDYSGASATGYYSGASATGYCSGASATGNCSGASATGYYSGASATGYYSGASATGYYSGASATGYRSSASATGNCSSASATGNCSGASAGSGSVALAVGHKSKVKGELGAYIVATECIIENYIHKIINIKSDKVDGEIIKADTWYRLENNEFVIDKD